MISLSLTQMLMYLCQRYIRVWNLFWFFWFFLGGHNIFAWILHLYVKSINAHGVGHSFIQSLLEIGLNSYLWNLFFLGGGGVGAHYHPIHDCKDMKKHWKNMMLQLFLVFPILQGQAWVWLNIGQLLTRCDYNRRWRPVRGEGENWPNHA